MIRSPPRVSVLCLQSFYCLPLLLLLFLLLSLQNQPYISSNYTEKEKERENFSRIHRCFHVCLSRSLSSPLSIGSRWMSLPLPLHLETDLFLCAVSLSHLRSCNLLFPFERFGGKICPHDELLVICGPAGSHVSI